jgi:hypothetical protein
MTPPDNHTHDFTSHPLVEVIDWNDAASPVESVTKRGLGLDPLRFGVDVCEPDIEILGPMRDQTPPQKIQAALASLAIVPDDGEEIGRRGVSSRREVWGGPMQRDREDQLDFANVAGEADAATHTGKIVYPANSPKRLDTAKRCWHILRPT